MQIDKALAILGLNRSEANKKTVRQAYARLAKLNKPETDPEGFALIRDAYETALAQIDDGINIEAIQKLSSPSHIHPQDWVAQAAHDHAPAQSDKTAQPLFDAMDAFDKVMQDSRNQASESRDAAQLEALTMVLVQPDLERIDLREIAANRIAYAVLDDDNVCSTKVLRRVTESFDYEAMAQQGRRETDEFWYLSTDLHSSLNERIANLREWQKFGQRATNNPSGIESILLYGTTWWSMMKIWFFFRSQRKALETSYESILLHHRDWLARLNASTLDRLNNWPREWQEGIAATGGIICLAIFAEWLDDKTILDTAWGIAFAISMTLLILLLGFTVWVLALMWLTREAHKLFAASRRAIEQEWGEDGEPVQMGAGKRFLRTLLSPALLGILEFTLLAALVTLIPWQFKDVLPQADANDIQNQMYLSFVLWIGVASLYQKVLHLRIDQLSLNWLFYLVIILTSLKLSVFIPSNDPFALMILSIVLARSHMPGFIQRITTGDLQPGSFILFGRFKLPQRWCEAALVILTLGVLTLACLDALALHPAVFSLGFILLFIWLGLNVQLNAPPIHYGVWLTLLMTSVLMGVALDSSADWPFYKGFLCAGLVIGALWYTCYERASRYWYDKQLTKTMNENSDE